jgi:hypothetical protein
MCIFDVVIRQSKRMHRIMMSSVACPALQHFSTLSHKRQGAELKMLVLILSINFFRNICRSNKN